MLIVPGGHRIVNEEKNTIVYIVRILSVDEDFGGKYRDILTEKTVCSAGMGTKCNGWSICVTIGRGKDDRCGV